MPSSTSQPDHARQAAKAAAAGLGAMVLAVYPAFVATLVRPVVGRGPDAILASLAPLALVAVVVMLVKKAQPLPREGRAPWIMAAVSASLAAVLAGITLAVAIIASALR